MTCILRDEAKCLSLTSAFAILAPFLYSLKECYYLSNILDEQYQRHVHYTSWNLFFFHLFVLLNIFWYQACLLHKIHVIVIIKDCSFNFTDNIVKIAYNETEASAIIYCYTWTSLWLCVNSSCKIHSEIVHQEQIHREFNSSQVQFVEASIHSGVKCSRRKFLVAIIVLKAMIIIVM